MDIEDRIPTSKQKKEAIRIAKEIILEGKIDLDEEEIYANVLKHVVKFEY